MNKNLSLTSSLVLKHALKKLKNIIATRLSLDISGTFDDKILMNNRIKLNPDCFVIFYEISWEIFENFSTNTTGTTDAKQNFLLE